MQMLALKEIHMTYGKGDGVVHALRGVDMEVERGELLAVTGKSGCGTVSYTHLTLPTIA